MSFFERVGVGVVGASFVLGCGAVGDVEPAPKVDAIASAVVGGTLSPATDDFVVYLARASTDPNKLFNCGGSLVAPNLIITAKHCVHEYLQNSTTLCDASGEPQPGSTGGFVTGPIPVGELVVYAGANGRKRYLDKETPDAVGKQIIDDKTPTLCSHDLAYLVLDKPVDKPVGKLRLAKRPVEGSAISIAGWGRVEKGPPLNGNFSQVRIRRPGITIKRVGPPAPAANAEGSLGPRLFETGPGGCEGDSGGPGFDEITGGIQGVLVRALNLDDLDPVSPCNPNTVTNVYMTVADFGPALREGFRAANAEPWLEGAEAPGYLPTGAPCGGSFECAAGFCAGLSDANPAGTCDIDCKSGLACPEGRICNETGNGCVVPQAAPPAPIPPTAPPEAEQPVSASGASCGAAPGRGARAGGNSYGIGVFLACAALSLRLLGRLRSRRS
jgi:hypothetical protein